jgi:enterochelin esterase family protein
MKKLFGLTFLLFSVWLQANAQNKSIASFLSSLRKKAFISDSLLRNNVLFDCLDSLKNASGLPLIIEDSVLFIYRGNAKKVDWMGDFNGWGYNADFKNIGTLIPNSNIWFLKASFPQDARLDYKVRVNENDWLLDVENPYQQWSGIGGGSPNSELRMPRWQGDPVLNARSDIRHGELKTDILMNSAVLGYQLNYNVYLPVDYKLLGKLPAVYVTDGYEYMHPKLGNMITILDNLIADKKINPIIVIFIDHREPINRANNKRMNELSMNEKYLTFFEKELIPQVETNFPVIPENNSRAILGESMGGLTAAYFAFAEPRLFGMAGIQSPAFLFRPQIYKLCDNPSQPIKISMTSGLISDASDASRKMKGILEKNACVYHYREVNDSHSWGNWRNLIDDILVDFFAYQNR